MKIIVSSENNMEDYFYPEIELIDKKDFYDIFNSDFKETEKIDGILIIDNQNFKDYDLLKKYFKKPILGSPRLPKNIQSIVLKQNNINCPKTYSIVSNGKGFSSRKLIGLLNDFKKTDKLVLKANNGAKGIGQILGTKEDIILLFESDLEEVYNTLRKENRFNVLYDKSPQKSNDYATYDEPKKYENETKFSEPENNNNHSIKCNLKEMHFSPVGENGSYSSSNYLGSILSSRDFLIQEFIENRDEYRLMYYFNQKPLIVKRNKKDNEWQSNACLTNLAYLLKESDNEYKKVIKGIFKQLDEFSKKEQVPFMAFDVYYDKNNDKWGVFEFQMEYACISTKGLDMFMVKDKMLKSIIDMFNYYKNINNGKV